MGVFPPPPKNQGGICGDCLKIKGVYLKNDEKQ